MEEQPVILADSPPESEDEAFFRDEMSVQVMDMLGFKIVPKVPGDEGYRDDTDRFPSEAVYYATEFCKKEDLIEELTRGKQELEREREELKIKLELVQGQLEENCGKVRGLEEECAGQKERLVEKERLIEEIGKERDELQEIVKEREQEVEEHRSSLKSLREEMEAERRKQREELERMTKEMEELREKLKMEQEQKEKVCGDLLKSEETVKKLGMELATQKEETEKYKTESEKVQESFDKVDADYAALERNAEKMIKEQEDRVLELERQVRNLEASKKEEVEKVQKQKTELQTKCQRLRSFIASLVAEFGVIIDQVKKNEGENSEGGSEEITTSAEQRLQQLSENTKTTFQNWTMKEQSLREELQNTQKFVESIMKIVTSNQKRKHAQEEPVATSTPKALQQIGSFRVPSATPIRPPPQQLPCASNSPGSTAIVTLANTDPETVETSTVLEEGGEVAASTSLSSKPNESTSEMWETMEEVNENDKPQETTTNPIPSTDNIMPKQHGVDEAEAEYGHFCLCGYQARTKSRLTEHINYHTGEKRFPCTVIDCNERFFSANFLRQHLLKKHNKRLGGKLGCRQCGKFFKTSKNLQQHQREAHSGVGSETTSISAQGNIEESVPDQLSSGQASTSTENNAQQQSATSDQDHLFSELMTSIETSAIHETSSRSSRKRKNSHNNVVHEIDKDRAAQGYFCVCGRKSANRAALEKHVNYFNPQCWFQCELCSKSYVGTNHLRVHMKKDHNLPYPYRGCRYCGSKFLDWKALFQHQKSAGCSKNQPECVPPEASSEPNNAVIKHEEDVSRRTDSQIFCTCGVPFSSKMAHDIHLNRVAQLAPTEDNKFLCDFCQKRFPTNWQLRKHLRKVHKVNTAKVKGRFGCKFCGRLFSKLALLKKHQRLAHGNALSKNIPGKRKVSLLIKATPTPTQVPTTSKTSQLDSVDTPAEDFKFMCKICTKRYKTNARLRAHLKEVHKLSTGTSKNSFGCTLCGRLFSKLGLLIQHRRLVHGNAPSRNLQKKRKDNLLNMAMVQSQPPSTSIAEIETLTTAPPPEAPVADLPSVKMEMLQEQPKNNNPLPTTTASVVHSEQDQHRRDVSKASRGKITCTCKREFPNMNQLKIHINWYKLTAKFKCLKCPLKFKMTSRVARHMKLVHNGYVYKLKGCNKCGGLFNDAAELRKHHETKHPSETRKVRSKNIPEVDLTHGPPTPAPISENAEDQENVLMPPPPLPPQQNVSTTSAGTPRAPPPLIPVALKQTLSVSKKKHGVDPKKQKYGYYCLCGIRTTDLKGLNAHIQYFTRERKFQCELCKSRFLHLSTLNAHMLRSHKIDNYGKPSFGCADCGNQFANHQELYQHKQVTHTPSPQTPTARKTPSSSSKSTLNPESDTVSNPMANTSSSSVTPRIPSFTITTSSFSSATAGSPLRPVNPKTYPAQKQKHGINMQKDLREPTCHCGAQFSNIREIQRHVRSHASTTTPKASASMETTIISSPIKTSSPVTGSMPISPSKFHKPVKMTQSPNLILCFCGRQFITGQQLAKHIREESATSSTNSTVSITPVTTVQHGAPVAETEESSASAEDEVLNTIENSAEVVPSFTELPLAAPIVSSCATALHYTETKCHALDRSNENSFFCICGLEFGSKDNVFAHVQYFVLGKKFPCDVCNKTFSKLKDVNLHKRKIHKENGVPGRKGCNTCGVIFASAPEFSKHHTKIFTPAGKLANVFCPGKLPRSSDASTAQALEVNGSSQTTQVTPSSPASRLESRIVSVDSVGTWIPLNPVISVRLGPSTTREPAVVTTTEEVTMQLVQPNQNAIQPDEVSPTPSTSRQSSGTYFDEHRVDHSKSDLGFYCFCGVRCASNDGLKKHIKLFTAERKFACTSCGKKFLIANQLRIHMFRAHKQVVQSGVGCKDCGEFFPTNMELFNHHRIVHNFGVPFEVELKYVPPTPATSTCSQQHSQEMSQELPIDLESCNTNAQQQTENQAEIHEEVANDPLADSQEIKCTCGKMFANKNSRRAHIRAKTRGKIFICARCPGGRVRFNLHSNLNVHMRSVHPGVTYEKFACGTCAKTFPTLDNVVQHRKTVHPNSKEGSGTGSRRKSINYGDSQEAINVDLNDIFES